MKKALYTILAAMLFTSYAFAQPIETTVEYSKKKQRAMEISYSYPQAAVENALVEKIEKLGYKSKTEKGLFNKDKGFIVFKDVLITDVSDHSLDYIVKIERKSRKDKDESTLYLLLNKNGGDAIPDMDAFSVGKVKSFLNNLIPDIEEANLELQIKDQESTVLKAEKKHKDLQDEKASLEKKIKKVSEDMDSQLKEVENQRASLDLLKAKRRPQQ